MWTMVGQTKPHWMEVKNVGSSSTAMALCFLDHASRNPVCCTFFYFQERLSIACLSNLVGLLEAVCNFSFRVDVYTVFRRLYDYLHFLANLGSWGCDCCFELHVLRIRRSVFAGWHNGGMFAVSHSCRSSFSASDLGGGTAMSVVAVLMFRCHTSCHISLNTSSQRRAFVKPSCWSPFASLPFLLSSII